MGYETSKITLTYLFCVLFKWRNNLHVYVRNITQKKFVLDASYPIESDFSGKNQRGTKLSSKN